MKLVRLSHSLSLEFLNVKSFTVFSSILQVSLDIGVVNAVLRYVVFVVYCLREKVQFWDLWVGKTLTHMLLGSCFIVHAVELEAIVFDWGCVGFLCL